MIKKAFSLLLVVFSLVFLGGCWSSKELSDLAIVLGAGVDRTPDNKVRITLQIARPAAFSGGAEVSGAGAAAKQNISWVVSETGDTILDAEQNLSLKVPRLIYWGQDTVLVIGEEMAKEGVRNISNFFIRNPHPRETILVLVARGEAEKVLKSHSELEKSSSDSIVHHALNKVGFSMMIKDFQMALASYGINPAAPGVEIQKAGQPQGVGMEETLQHEEAVITGTAVFKDDRLVGWLDTSETRGFMCIRGEVKKGIVIIPSPGQPDKMLSLNILQASSTIDPEYDGKTIRFNVRIKTEWELLEQQSIEDLSTPEKIRAIEKTTAEYILKRCEAVLHKTQGEYGTDVIGFGEAFHRKYKKEWKRLKDHWNEVFAKAEVNITEEAHLQRTGLELKRASEKM